VRPSERLTALALLAYSLAVALSRPSGAGPRLLLAAAILSGVLVHARTGATRGPLGFLRDWFPVVVVLGLYLLLQPVIEAVNPRRYDALLAAADARWFGPLAAGWRDLLGRPPWLTDLLYAAYASFYLLPVGVAAAARWRRGAAAFEQVVLPLLLGFYLSFLGYFLWPALGPRVPRAAEAGALGGGAVSDLVRDFLATAEATTLDAFPSGHTAVSVLSAVLGARLFPRAAPWLVAWAAAVVTATVYVRVHYVVDVVAGAALAALTLGLAPPLARAFGGPGTPWPLRQPGH
jgi:membrane-associated phospholipid phosphatase